MRPRGTCEQTNTSQDPDDPMHAAATSPAAGGSCETRPFRGLILSVRMPVALGCTPLLVLLAIFVGIARGLLDGFKRNAFKIRAMDALAIKGLGLSVETRLLCLIWRLVGRPFALLARVVVQRRYTSASRRVL